MDDLFTVIGCGNANRCDDGVGSYVAGELARELENAASHAAHVQVFDAGTGGLDVMFRARGSRHLVIVDACSSGSAPGSVFEVPGSELAAEQSQSLSLHEFRWQHALYAGRRIYADDFPEDVSVFLIEAASLELGCELSEPVRCAANKVTGLLLQRLREHGECHAH